MDPFCSRQTRAYFIRLTYDKPGLLDPHPHAPAKMSPARIPHPEVYMEYIAEDLDLRAWHYQLYVAHCFF